MQDYDRQCDDKGQNGASDCPLLISDTSCGSMNSVGLTEEKDNGWMSEITLFVVAERNRRRCRDFGSLGKVISILSISVQVNVETTEKMSMGHRLKRTASMEDPATIKLNRKKSSQ